MGRIAIGAAIARIFSCWHSRVGAAALFALAIGLGAVEFAALGDSPQPKASFAAR